MIRPAMSTPEGAVLRVAIAGLGRGAVLTTPGLLAHERITLAGGCDPSSTARAAFTATTSLPAVEHLEALLGDPAIDAIYVASPHEFHAEHAIAAARAGKHVLVEKPMAVDLAQAGQMVRAARDAGVVLMVGPSHGYDGPVALAASLARQSGGARLIHAFGFTDFLYRPRRPAELQRELGGGVVFSQASHQIDLVRRIAGAPIDRVRGWIGNWDPARAADGAYTAMIMFEGGAAASLTYSGYARYDSDALAGWVGEMGRIKDPAAHALTRRALTTSIEGEAKHARGFAAGMADPAPHHERFGQVVVCCADADLEIVPDGVIVHGSEGPVLHSAPPIPAARWQVADAFARAVLDGEPPVFDGRWGLMTLATCHALIASSETGRDVSPAELLKEIV
jgi:phthalate 4,5-cis-dihydrodiol dehydrogenase